MATDAPPSATETLRRLAEIYAELQAEVDSVDTVAGTMEAVVKVTVRRLDGADEASITTLRHGKFRTAVTTGDIATRGDAIQYELGSGPCVDAIVNNTTYNPEDLREDPRWPEYGRRVSEELGVRSMLSFRLAADVEGLVAGLNVYSTTDHAFSEDSAMVGLLLAAQAAPLVAAKVSHEKAMNLQKAVQTNRDIGTAMGVLMGLHKVTREQAYDLLRIASQATNRKLRDVATHVIDTGAVGLASEIAHASERVKES